MWQLFIGSLVLSIIHAAIPNHWIPLIAIGKTEKWTIRETINATLVTGFSHTLSTIIIGIIVGFIGIRLTSSYNLIMSYIAPSIISGIGVIYIILHFTKHNHSHAENELIVKTKNMKSKVAILATLSIAMFLTPCAEIEAYYFQAGMIGWKGIFLVSAVYTLITVLMMLILVYTGLKGTQRLRSHALEHNEKLITGTVLIILGIMAFILKY